VLKKFNANFIGDTPSPASVSEKIRTDLINSEKSLAKKSGDLYTEVNGLVGRGTQVDVPVFKQTVGQEIKDKLDDIKNLSPLEQGLYNKFSGNVSYAMLDDTLKELRAADKNVGIYRDLNSYTRKKYIDALAKDKLDAVSSIAGEEARQKLLSADVLTGQKKELRDSIVKYYGENHEGSIATAIDNAIKEASKSGTQKFTNIMKTIPQEYKKEAIATSIANLVKSGASTVEGGAFGFTNYTNLYKGLRANPKMLSEITKTLGEGAGDTLLGLYKISKQLTTMVRPNALTTGRPYQKDFMQGLVNANSLINRVLDSKYKNIARPAIRYGSTAAGAVFGGGLGAVGAQSFGAQILENAGKASSEYLQAAGKLLNSAQFQETLKMVVQNPESPQAIKKLSRTKALQEYAKKMNIKGSPADWEDYLKAGGGAVVSTQAQPGMNQQQPTGMQQ